MSSTIFGYAPTALWEIVHIYWIIPAGMIALYFYGMFHFNTPDYSLDFGNLAGSPSFGVTLITPAPPMFTTSRARFNRYARRYVIVLEAAFIAFIFFSSLIGDITRVTSLELPLPASAESIQYKAIWALFALTGLLSSFPGFKDIDTWLLSTLHRAAFIPDDVRILAEKLYASPFSPTKSAIALVRPNLATRDMIRIADGTLTGSLEQRVFQLLCLRTQLQLTMSTSKYTGFKIKLTRDLRDIENQSQGLKSELWDYLRDQEKLISRDVQDIDALFSQKSGEQAFTELGERRQRLQGKCDTIYETMCLLTALSVFATESAPEDIDQTLTEMGFTVNVERVPLLDWDAVARVVGSMFILMVIVNATYAFFSYALGLDSVNNLVLDRVSVVRFALLFTVVYAGIMLIAMKLKRKWRREDDPDHNRPENLIIALVSYAASLLLFSIPFSLYLRHDLTIAPFLFAVNQGVLGYFIGVYIDRSLGKQGLSVKVAAWHGVTQLITIVIATTAVPLPNVGSRSELYVTVFSAVQSALSGFLIGVFFQYFHQRSVNSEQDRVRNALGDSPVGTVLLGRSRSIANGIRASLGVERHPDAVMPKNLDQVALPPLTGIMGEG
jgi:hypothetical protein